MKMGPLIKKKYTLNLYNLTQKIRPVLDTEAFERIMGFLTDVLKRNIVIYEQMFTDMARRNTNLWRNQFEAFLFV